MNKQNGVSGDVHGRRRGLDRTHTVNLGSRSGLIKAPLLQAPIKNGQLPRHPPKALALSVMPRLRAVDLQLRTSGSSYVHEKESRAAAYAVLTQSQKRRATQKAKSI
jgi:hypothetical protein